MADVCFPVNFLERLKGQSVIVRLKSDAEYRGVLLSFDTYFNLQLANTQEFCDGQFQGSLGEVLIRCNNVAWVQDPSEVKVKKAEQ